MLGGWFFSTPLTMEFCQEVRENQKAHILHTWKIQARHTTGIAEQKSPQDSPLGLHAQASKRRRFRGAEGSNTRINKVVKSNTLLPITLQHPNSSLAFDSTGCLIDWIRIPYYLKGFF